MSTLTILQILGGLGVFLFGLRVMSNGLQKLAGNRLRAVLRTMTSNRLAGMVSGFLITATIQSSSATTVLVVSFANAGLLTLTQAIGLVMGANIGTTVTGWLVALLGFKVNIASFALPVIGLAFPLSFLRSARAKQLSEVFVGFGLLFLGLKFLKEGVPDLKSNPEALEFLQSFADHGFASVLLFVAVGTIITVIVQSSSATMTITLTMAAKGWIDFDLAAAMVLGENVGTTITAQLAAIGANRNAHRVATSHTLFNIFGVLWMLPMMGVFLGFIDGLVPGDPWMHGGESDPAAATAHLAAFHTAFNIINTCVLIGFVNHIASLVFKLLPRRGEGHKLRFLEFGRVGAPELAGLEARRGLQYMAAVCVDMAELLKEILARPKAKLGTIVDDIKRGEARTDELEEEIVAFCARMGRAGISAKVSRNIGLYLEMANDIERMGDHCFNLVMLAERRYEKEYEVDEDTRKELGEMIDDVADFIWLVHRALGSTVTEIRTDARILETRINKRRDQARKRQAEQMKIGEVDIRAGLIYIDMMTNMEKLGDYCWNVVESLEQVEASR